MRTKKASTSSTSSTRREFLRRSALAGLGATCAGGLLSSCGGGDKPKPGGGAGNGGGSGRVLLDDQAAYTLPVVLGTVSGGQGQWDWPRLAAVYMLTIIPALAAFAFAQRWYMQGLQEGALKG